MGRPIRILVVDDSATCRAGLKRILAADGDIEVVGEADSGERALELLVDAAPDLILMDILMPGIDGLKTTEKIMELDPTPVLIISNVAGRSADLNFRALQAGALDIISKPHESQFENPAMQKRFLRKIRLLAEIPMITRRGGGVGSREKNLNHAAARVEATGKKVRLLAVGASTGGPPALQVLLSSLDPDLPFPVLVVQHMSTGFIGGLAGWLSHSTGRNVKLAEHGVRPDPGIVYLAPDRCHMEISGDSIRLNHERFARPHCPSVDVLFESIARDAVAADTIAVILTGMGSDGTDGLTQIRLAGGWTIAQDKSSSVVFGMPRAAIEKGVIDEVVPLDRIGNRINSICRRRTVPAAFEFASKPDKGGL